MFLFLNLFILNQGFIPWFFYTFFLHQEKNHHHEVSYLPKYPFLQVEFLLFTPPVGGVTGFLYFFNQFLFDHSHRKTLLDHFRFHVSSRINLKQICDQTSLLW
tara:strand:+ start:3060 stop:3368 length:309 start_codon:yes stop_codon:yes gene_type:complete